MWVFCNILQHTEGFNQRALNFNLVLLISPDFFIDILTHTRIMIAPKVLKYLLHCAENAYLAQKKKKLSFLWLSLGPSGKLIKSLYLIIILFCTLSTSVSTFSNNVNVHYFINWSRKSIQSQLHIPWNQHKIVKCVFSLSYVRV